MKCREMFAVSAAALGLIAQNALAHHPQHQHTPRQHSSQQANQHFHRFQDASNRPHARSQPRRHTQHYSPPATRIVVVPAFVPRAYYYAPAPVAIVPPAYVAPPTYVAPPMYVAPPAPSGGQTYAPEPSQYLFYCPDNRLYYPEVRECFSGWLAVVPGVAGPPN